MSHKTIFLSYSWDSPEHKNWVLNLANRLVTNGIDVIFDQYDLSAGMEMTYFMEKAITADKILVILTPEYKKKADKREGGAGFEHSLISLELYKSDPIKTKVIPVIRNGTKDTSCPVFIETRVFHDMRDDKFFNSKFFELVKILSDEPLVKKPKLGKLPDFNNEIPDVEATIIEFREKERFLGNKKSIIESEAGVEKFEKSTREIVEQIEKSLINYRENFGLGFHIKKEDRPIGILFSTVYFTFFFRTEGLYSNSANSAKIILNFFKGPVGLDPSIDYSDKQEVIYRTKYKFDLDQEMNPIYTRVDNSNISLNTNEVATFAVRELILNEIKRRSKKL
ncbi:toll/interleukin-1 receptor domain-containing protein [Psychroflexus sp. MES1-P1E]|uniref:toll/interleukin-1 receptor domain-containing protein n=1 Tax=Psychroflexus sp. MES1-P1E TaxID=2058320 RepID=UPI000C7B1282|nr:toll/interleukin-1 receptor domain-containing protein [Psychroflexus sp. MES1-P1E]PKG42516.1 hypothetical protein CXF67_09870 [Psychroflexus sp. MES1-P1E]